MTCSSHLQDLAFDQDQDVLQVVTACLDVLVAADPRADVVTGNWQQDPVAPWVAAAFEVGLQHLDCICPVEKIMHS
jgi:hypothetical protein